jgi:hypothetical protein
MSLESKIEALTVAVAQLTAVMQAGKATVQQAAPVVQAPAPAPVAAPVAAPVVAAMPAPPTFAPPNPNPGPTTPGAPFTDPQGLMQYVMGAYQAMGPAKGAQIQQILSHIGCTNINEVKPEQYGQLYTLVEQLKAS